MLLNFLNAGNHIWCSCDGLKVTESCQVSNAIRQGIERYCRRDVQWLKLKVTERGWELVVDPG